jgi:hypothetical protein
MKIFEHVKKVPNILLFLILAESVQAQIIREFSGDTATYIPELIRFTGTSLETSEVPDFERFLRLYDSLPHEQRMDIIQVSNMMLALKCRPRPQFIQYQRVMLEFFDEDKTFHGYEQWLEGLKTFLKSDRALLQTVTQWLSLSLLLLEDNTFYSSSAVMWKASEPSFRFQNDSRGMTVGFEDVTLACYSGQDFIQIMNASGYIDPLSLEWIGNRGRVTWERVGVPENELHATLGHYRINLKTSGYSADSASLYYPAYFGEEVLGRLEDKVMLIKNFESAKYPQFVSYRNSYRIDNFAPGVNYRGGLAVEGANLAGTGVEGKRAVMEIFSKDTLRMKILTDRATLNDRFMRSPSSTVTIYLGSDSIYHPDLVFMYDIGKEEVRLIKSENFTSQGPYSNSYHHIDMNFDELYWNRNESIMRLQPMLGTSIGRATFESNTFFNYDFFMELQGMDYDHPLVQLWSYSRYLQGRTFALTGYANYIRYPPYQVRHQLMSLSKLGFVYYDDETDLITVRQKLFDYIDASMQKRDYDVIRFISRTEGASNATLDLKTRDLTIRGIPSIFLSDSQNVRLVPSESSIVMKRDRNFEFDGMVDAGLFRFYGHNFFFQYDSFKINLQDIDSLQLFVKTGEYNNFGEALHRGIDNKIEQMTGELLIDDPRNKSGLENYPIYPKFTSREEAYVFFDEPSIQNGVYKRDAFYFRLDSFSVDSLDNFRREAIALKGTFVSASILPQLDMEMTLREDNSLGFYLRAPDEGIPLYGGMGTFYNDIEMSSRGLHGYGSFDFLTSTTWSDDFLMHPDSMMARSRRYLIREHIPETQYPRVENTEVDVKLIPGREVMHASRVRETFKMFGDSVFLAGNLSLRPSGLSGDGVMALPDARLESDRFRYGVRSIRADSAGIRLRSEAAEEFAFLTDDVAIDVDLDARTGEFTARADQTLVEMPYNMYETRLDRMTWFMDRQEVAMSQEKYLPENDVDIGIDSLKTNGPTYISRHPGQDELQFVSPEAIYDYRGRLLHAHRVPFIAVADAYIFPEGGDVDIGYQATMGMLEHAKVLASQLNRQHLIFNASIAVSGARQFSGSGTYNYLDAFGNSYPIQFARIWVDTTMQTRSSGTVEPDDDFMLSPFFDYQGEVFLYADNPRLTFDGGARVVHDCNMGKEWLRFTAELDPGDIRIPVGEQMQNTALQKIFAGSLITRDSTHIYPAFLTGRKDYFDASITDASGILLYDPDRESYIISTPEKIADSTLPGRYLRLNTASCELYGEGPINLNLDYGQVKITSAGNAVHLIGEDEFSVRLVMGLDFYFSPEALQVMGQEIDSLPDLEPVNLIQHHYRLAMRDLLGVSLARKLERELELTGLYDEIPPEWEHTIFFNDLPLKWNQDSRSFRYNGKVGIGNIGNIQVNKKVDAYIELAEKGSGDIFDIYLQVDRNTWYYIAYSPGGLQVLSSNREFNNIVFDLKASERRVRAGLGQPQYIYSLAAPRRLELFIDRFLEYEESEEEGESEVF